MLTSFLTVYLEIIVDSQEVVKIIEFLETSNGEVAIVQSKNQEINIWHMLLTRLQTLFSFTFF